MLLLSASVGAGAGPVLTLDADSVSLSNASDFTVTFDDLDGDSRLDFGEILTFSGVSINTTFGFLDMNTITQAPLIAGISDFGGSCVIGGTNWCFSGPAGFVTRDAGAWTYTISGTPSVPEPGTLALLAGALIAAGVAGRRRK